MPFPFRKPRFTLFALMAFTTLCCAIGGLGAWYVSELRQRAATIAELQASGAEVHVDLGPLAFDSVSFSSPLSDRQIELVERLGKLDALNLPAVGLSDEEVDHLCRSEPSYLELSGGSLSDMALDRIAANPRLEQLWLTGVRFNGGRTVAFARPESLRCFATTEPTVDDHCLQSLEKCVNLDQLLLENTSITDAGLTSLHGLRGPIQISLKKARITADGVIELLRAVYGKAPPGNWRRLIVIRLEGIDFDAADVRRIVETAHDVGIVPHRVRFDDRWHTPDQWPDPTASKSVEAAPKE